MIAKLDTPTKPSEWDSHLATEEVTSVDGEKLMAAPHNRFLRPLVHPGMRVLEAGAGNGRYVFAFAKAGALAVGLDFSKKLVERVRKLAKHARLDNVIAEHGDMMGMPFADNHFDLYTSFGVYEHFQKKQHALLFKEAFRVVKPGGLIYIEVPHFWSPWTVRREFRYWFRKIRPPRLVWQRNMSRRYLTYCAEQAGFETIETRVFDAWYGFEKGFSLKDRKLMGFIPNPWHALRPIFKKLAAFCEKREWMGETLVYIGRKSEADSSDK
jgi:ubiquinone/menaquinone biosynthesis C-methylase UbiE